MEYFSSSYKHILAELERIDLLIQAQIARARHIQQIDQDFLGLYIPEEEINELLARPAGLPRWATAPIPFSLSEVNTSLERISADIAKRKTESAEQGIKLRLDELRHLFDLTQFDIDALLICIAPELDLRYERIYSYLQDDVTKKRPSVDLVLNLLSQSFEAKLERRQYFSSEKPLIKFELLKLFDDPANHNPPLLGKCLKVDERVMNYLLGSDELDSRVQRFCSYSVPQVNLDDLLLSPGIKDRLLLLTKEKGVNGNGLLFYFQGTYGVGKQTTAEALCRELGIGLLVINIEQILKSDESVLEKNLRLIGREALLHGSAFYWGGFDSLINDDNQTVLELLIRELEYQKRLTFLAGGVTWEPMNALHDLPFMRVEFDGPAYAERVKLWRRSLDGNTPEGAGAELEAVANKFRFTGGQIHDAAATARNLARWRDPENSHISKADLYTACRLQSNRRLSSLAKKITPFYKWDDIVLPPEKKEQLREVCNYVKYRSVVYDDWGFDKKLSLGKGLNILFAGASGTGKTMAAEVVAGELGLDLYKIDLSSMVSKYIGETEKNLSRIFSEAETSNAILFFDEADALFGKRSEVRDSHDRYANVEISYLLQRMEEYEGVVILATNLRKNMDDAFVRRMHFTIEFPFPTDKYRRLIWEGIWSEKTPRSVEIDFGFMSRSFEIAGGNIKNVALAAAFLAAADGKVVNMTHLVNATKREYQKMGKVVVDGEFGEYAGSVT